MNSTANDTINGSEFSTTLTFTISFSILLIIILFIGMIGNFLVIYVVLNYGRLKTVTNTYLLHLAISDLIFLSGVPFLVAVMISKYWIFGYFLCKLFFLTQGINQYTSIMILALLAFDRYLAVCYSSKSLAWRSKINPNFLLLLTWILSLILMLPIIIFTQLVEHSQNHYSCNIILPFEQTRVLYLLYSTYTSAITFIFPLILMTYFYIQIIRRMKKNIPQHRRSRTSLRTRRKVSILVLAVIGVHVFCCSPYWCFQYFIGVLTTSEVLVINPRYIILISTVAQFLLFANSTTNPLLYAFLSEVFRSSFTRVFHCCTKDPTYLEGTVNKQNQLMENLRQRNNTIKITLTTSLDDNNIGRKVSKKAQFNSLDPLLRQEPLSRNSSIFTSEKSFCSEM
ncbi:unnamed protein product [Didymodactylos carnosus]|uniref:G-protein coupled receptors family 1 profile domain-containing protein n=1 Tax=Didymodactylos carnosus TaxID=1234261 RepID=A0A815H994_9BILA|nr:unnamed protein product [Didymodactylos carnosus]CAF4217386.1 unnamed protein product [Didymodactylos carnosus]